MGIVSTGTDSLMSTTVQPALAGTGFGGNGMPGQQNGMNGAMNRLPGPQAESGNQEGQGQKKKSSAGSVLSSTFMACMAGFMGLLLPALL
jgi:hypothetical protein